jgi:hypothetical protein
MSGRRLAAIRCFHRAAGLEAPTGDEKVKAVLSGIAAHDWRCGGPQESRDE